MQIPRLREWRERSALTQKELAEKAGKSVRSVAGYEAGAGANPGTVRALATALGVEIVDLLGAPEAPKASATPDAGQHEESDFEAKNSADAERLRALARPVLTQLGYNIETLEALLREDKVDQSAYQLSWSLLRSTLVGFGEVFRILEEEGIDWTNRQNRKILRAHDELQFAFIALDKTQQSIVDRYFQAVTKNSRERERLRRAAAEEQDKFLENHRAAAPVLRAA